MLKLKLQFFSEDDDSQAAVKTFTQEEVDKLLNEKEQGFKSQLARMKQKQQTSNEPQVTQQTSEPETASTNTFDIEAILKQNEELVSRLDNLEQHTQQSQLEIQKQQLINQGVDESAVDVVLTATKGLESEQANMIISKFTNNTPNTTTSRQGVASPQQMSDEQLAQSMMNQLLGKK